MSLTSDIQMTPANSRNWRGAKKPLDKGERAEWKNWLRTQHSKTKIIASGPITSWLIDGEKGGYGGISYFLVLQITVSSDWSHDIKRILLLGRKDITNINSTLKSRDITLSTKVCLVKAMVFPVVMYGCESWTIKKAEYQRIDAFELWYWRRFLRVP